MHTILLVPGGLVEQPDWEAAGRALADAGVTLDRLRRARRVEHRGGKAWAEGAAHLQWLAERFQVPGDPPPTAPYAWTALGGRAGEAAGFWFCDPVHLMMGRDRTMLAPVGDPPLSPDEAAALLRDADAAAREADCRIELRGGRWFLLTGRPWALDTIPLQAAIGASVESRLPAGPDASRWRRLLNDIQMRWHASPVNRNREQRGVAAVNALWLHGGGRAQALAASAFAQVDGDDPVLAGWQGAAANGDVPRQRRLRVRTALFEPWWRKDWEGWALAWSALAMEFAGRSDAAVEVVACGRGGCAHFGPSGPLGWLRPRSLRECLIERS